MYINIYIYIYLYSYTIHYDVIDIIVVYRCDITTTH